MAHVTATAKLAGTRRLEVALTGMRFCRHRHVVLTLSHVKRASLCSALLRGAAVGPYDIDWNKQCEAIGVGALEPATAGVELMDAASLAGLGIARVDMVSFQHTFCAFVGDVGTCTDT